MQPELRVIDGVGQPKQLLKPELRVINGGGQKPLKPLTKPGLRVIKGGWEIPPRGPQAKAAELPMAVGETGKSVCKIDVLTSGEKSFKIQLKSELEVSKKTNSSVVEIVDQLEFKVEKFHSELDVLKQRAREIPRTLTEDEIRACEAVKLQMKGKLPEPGKISVAEVEKIDEVVRAANASGKVESAANVESVAESAKQGMSGITDDVFTMGKEVFDRFDVNRAYVKPKHLSTTGGNGQKFLGESKASAENVLRNVISKGKIISISDNGLTKAGNASYEIIIDAGKPVGTRGENLVKIVISSDGGMLSAYPIK